MNTLFMSPLVDNVGETTHLVAVIRPRF